MFHSEEKLLQWVEILSEQAVKLVFSTDCGKMITNCLENPNFMHPCTISITIYS